MTAPGLLLFRQGLQVLLGAVSTASAGPFIVEGPTKGLARPVSISREVAVEYALEDSKGKGSPALDGSQCRLETLQGLCGHVSRVNQAFECLLSSIRSLEHGNGAVGDVGLRSPLGQGLPNPVHDALGLLGEVSHVLSLSPGGDNAHLDHAAFQNVRSDSSALIGTARQTPLHLVNDLLGKI